MDCNRPLRVSVLLSVLVALLFCGGHTVGSAGPATGKEPGTLIRVAFTQEMFSEVNEFDALASFKAWLDTVASNRGIHAEVTTRTFEEQSLLKKALDKEEVDVLVIHAYEYLTLDCSSEYPPNFVPYTRGDAFDQYLLLVRDEDGIRDIRDLRESKLVMFVGTGASLTKTWVRQLLDAHGLSEKEPSFFQSISEVSKVSAAVLPVFFGNKDACIVDGNGFATMVELNPQLATKLKILNRSRNFVETMICIREGYKDLRADLLESLGTLHLEPRGQQMLMVFKVDRLIPFEQAHLQSLRDFLSVGETL